MLTRRQTLLVSASFCALAPAAIGQPRHPTQSKTGSRGKKDAGSGGSPADTPIGPVDTLARWAYVMLRCRLTR
jgi:serine-type D-Ala-D-Ala carboxypeptidase (penicillin-binding protein 5/6)